MQFGDLVSYASILAAVTLWVCSLVLAEHEELRKLPAHFWFLARLVLYVGIALFWLVAGTAGSQWASGEGDDGCRDWGYLWSVVVALVMTALYLFAAYQMRQLEAVGPPARSLEPEPPGDAGPG